MDFIVTASQPLRSVTFAILPYGGGQPMHQATKEFTAKGPFAPNRAYQFRGPKLTGSKHAWPTIRSLDDCVSVVGLNVKKADGSVVQVEKNKIGHYVTPNVNEACVPQNFPMPRG